MFSNQIFVSVILRLCLGTLRDLINQLIKLQIYGEKFGRWNNQVFRRNQVLTPTHNEPFRLFQQNVRIQRD